MKIKNLSLVIVLIAAAAVFSQVSAQSVSGSIAGGAVTRGKAAPATVVLSIPGGLHVNSNRPNSEYAVATVVRATSPGVKIGPVSYPRGKNRKFSFSENTINVYEGRTSFGFNVTVPTTFRGSRVSVRVTVKYQACTDEVCYPPKTKEVTLTA
ncbi:MAG: protein-disulfide reductase DsbD N-terminal domain-containing protein, partial [Pyrinomonadaceae bacterium]|nr:protein-disulfide reductase DsbD N-terminal domain-containing protein [Pyrinomonadaceae bacterium]